MVLFNNMKIGILTYHRSHNYGALLQGIALREVLTRAGHNVTFIDYWPAYHRHMYALFSFHWMMSLNGLKGKLSYLINCVFYYSTRKIRKSNFDKFISEYIEPYTSSVDEYYDVIVHGSDQIWRKQPEINAYNPVYFGMHGINTQKKISYAASMGILPQKDSEKAILKEYISHLDSISVREKSLQELVMNLGFEKVSHDLDPTLLLNQEYWVNKFKLVKNDKPYALYYKIQDSFDIQELRRYAKSKGLNLKVIHSRARCAESEENITTASPLQFLQLMYSANMVFTSSFHGLVFSLIFHKPFFASFICNSGRAESLLSKTGLNDRLVKPKTSVPVNTREIDFLSVRESLGLMISLSMENLKKDISNYAS